MISIRRSTLLRNVNPAPPDWRKAFGNSAPIEVDLGCGRGSYAWQRATRFPEVNVVALDVRRKWIQLIRKQARKAGLLNLRAIRCDVTQDLCMLFSEGSITGFTSHHPDPWWKKRHKKRRMIRPEVVALLAHLLIPGGGVYLQSDVPDLADEMRACFESHEAFISVDAYKFLQNRLGGLQSHRERKCIEKGIPIERMAYIIKGEELDSQ
jgi:tRNA (guanine-N7-)-methyltransferase